MNTPLLNHLALIMDGNRRWATGKGLPKMLGHTEGAKNLKRIIRFAQKNGIPYLTFYALSTENLKNRSSEELEHLFSLISKLPDYIGDFEQTETRFHVIGDLTKIPENPRKHLEQIMQKTTKYQKHTVTFAINYGGRDEIVRAAKKLLTEKIDPQLLTEEIFESHLDTSNIPDVDLMIRTGGDQRLSNYLPWQTTYAELYFTSTYWPEFSEENLQTALDWFQEQKRNKGK